MREPVISVRQSNTADPARHSDEDSQARAAEAPSAGEVAALCAALGADTTPARVGPRLSPAGGVIIDGLDVSLPLLPAARDLVFAAFCAHHVVVLRDQSLSREQQFTFAAAFGEVEHSGAASHSHGKRHGVAHIISNLDQDGRPVDRSLSPLSNYHWHTDKPYYHFPPMMTALYAVEVPPAGGDTEFANMVMAYTALTEEIRQRIAGHRVVFCRRAAGAAPAPAALPDTMVDHPLVRTHPDTGAKALYLGNHASHIDGLPELEGRELLATLLAHATQRQFVYVHRWRTGDLVIWDNRCLLHRAVANFDMTRYRRVMHRSVVRGTVPV
jgi:alpha-ketoglutarate-dependent taurine dioxygenase